MIKNLLLAVAILTISTTSLRAQENTHSSFSAGPSIQFKEESFAEHKHSKAEDNMPTDSFLKKEAEEEGLVIEDKHAINYISPTVQNLSRLYWKKNALELSNDKAVDNYLLINECAIYSKFYEDDFEWVRVRGAARDMLSEKKDGFAEHFKIIIPLDLGRYDMDRKGFPLVNKTAFKDLRRVEVGGSANDGEICGMKQDIKHYPRNIILALNKPFNFEFLKLDEHIAQAFVIRRKYEKIDLPSSLKFRKFKRPVFARIRVQINNFNGVTRTQQGDNMAVMIGKIDGIDIFEDSSETRLLKSIEN